MDALEDSWWPSSITQLRPFTLPPSSQWLFRQDGAFLTIRVGRDAVEYRTHPNYLPFLMLLDAVQLTYLGMSNSAEVGQQESFYKGVIFLDFLRGEFLSAVQSLPGTPSFETQANSVPGGMRRWLCRLLHGIPHDPQNRRHHAQLLNKVAPVGENADFLGWSFAHEEELVGCLSTLTSDSTASGASLYHPSEQPPLRWLKILRSQFVQASLCTDSSVSLLREQSRSDGEDGVQQNDPVETSASNPSDAFAAPPPQEESGTCLISPPHTVAPDSSKNKESIPPQSAILQVHRGRGRPRSQRPHKIEDAVTMEPKRKLRTRKNARAASEDPWENLSKAPSLTPLSPKKPSRVKGLQKPSRPPGSNKGREFRVMKNQQGDLLKLPSKGPDESEVQVKNIDQKHVEPASRSVQTQPAMKKGAVAKEQAKSIEDISTCSKHFKYISTMASFDDPYFKETVKKELLKNQTVTWSAFQALSPASKDASASNWETLKNAFELSGENNPHKAQAIRNLDRIYQRHKRVSHS